MNLQQLVHLVNLLNIEYFALSKMNFSQKNIICYVDQILYKRTKRNAPKTVDKLIPQKNLMAWTVTLCN